MIARMMRFGGLFVICIGVAGAMLLMGNQRFESRYNRVPMVQDWTHRHMVYSHPKTIIQNLQVQRQPRYVQQVLHRNFSPRLPIGRRPIPKPIRFQRPKMSNDLHRDWQELMPAAFTMGDGNSPAKYTFDVNAAPDCANDFVVFTQTSTNSPGTVTIYALNNLYTGTCTTGTVPNVLWAYTIYTNAGGAVVGAPVLSLDGTQVAWMESAGSGTGATLHILKPYTGTGVGTADGTLAAPNTPPTSASAADYRACVPAAPTGGGATSQACLYSIPFADGNNDTTSSPYYEYSQDLIFVGDASGSLHAFSGVFDGAPAELTANGWPVAVDAGAALTNPIYDPNSQHAFVGDSSGQLSYVIASGTPVTGTLGGTVWNLGSGGISNDGPIVDGTTGRVFVFANVTGTGAVVGEADTSLGTPTGPVSVGSSTASPLHTGEFDNLYYNSDTGAGTGTGFLYVCGNNGVSNQPELYQIAVTGGTMSTGAPTPEFTAATASTECSPVTEFYNSTTSADSVYFSVQASGNASTDCANEGCVFAATLTPIGAAETVTVSGAMPASGGASGIIVDNDSAVTGGTNIYYSWLGGSSSIYPCNSDTTGKGCTVQVAQLGLGSAGVVVQQASGDCGACTGETTFFNNPSYVLPGNLILIFSHWDGAGITATASDNAGNTYTALGPATNIGSNNYIQAWYAVDSIGHFPYAFTVNYSGPTASISLVDAVEYSGLDTTAPVDSGTYVASTGIGTALTTGPSGTTTFDNETIVGMFATTGGGGFRTTGPGFTVDAIDATSLIEDENVSILGSSTTATATVYMPTNWGAVIVGFKNAVQ
jgi:hypothetical protein